MFHFYNTCLNSFNISSLFSCGIIIYSLGLTILSAICFLAMYLAALWTTFSEAVFRAYSPVFSNSFPYLLDRFLANDKNPYHLAYFLVLGSIE